jgi:AcrR family transcriptional regulator
MALDGAPNTDAPKTVLDRHLAGLEPIKPTPLDALAAARRAYHQGQRIDMGVLAAELGVSRVTLNRWVGTREDLLGEVTWDLMRRTLDRVDREATASGSANGPATGGARVIAALRGLVESATEHEGHQMFVEREGVLAMRINTSAKGRVEPRLVAYVRKLLTEEINAGRMRMGPDDDATVDAVAYAVVQVTVAFIWRPFITGEPPNPLGLESVLRLMLCDSQTTRSA